MTLSSLQTLIDEAGERYFGMKDLPEYFQKVEESDIRDEYYPDSYKRVLIVKDDVNDKYYRIENYCGIIIDGDTVDVSDDLPYQTYIEEVVPVPITKIVWQKR